MIGRNTSGYEKPRPKKTSQARKKRSVKMSSMNKHKKRQFKVTTTKGDKRKGA